MALGRAIISALLLRPPPSPAVALTRHRLSSPRRHAPALLRMSATTESPAPDADAPALFPSREEAQVHAARTALLRPRGGGGDPSSHPRQSTPLVRCGELACQVDSFRRTLGGCAVLGYALYVEENSLGGNGKRKKKGCKQKEQPPPPAAAAKRGGVEDGAASAGTSASSPLRCALVLSDSIFFPEGGGQPADAGRIYLGGDDERTELAVLDARNLDGACVLTCSPVAARAGGDDLPGALRRAADAGEGACVRQDLDWDRRFDHMTQHSAQHLLSAIAASDDFGNMHTASFRLGRGGSATSYVDFEVDPHVDLEEHRRRLRGVEETANEQIRRNLPMTPRYLDPDSPEFKEKVRSRLLPEGLTGPIRLVEIGGGVDLNTCCGTHVPSLGHLQMIKLFRIERVKANVVRTHFAAAKRLHRIVDGMHQRQTAFTSMLSCIEDEHVERLQRLLDDKTEKEREMKALRDRMCSLQAKGIARECREGSGVAAVDLGSGIDMAYMLQLSWATMEELESENGSGKVLLLFVSSAEDAPGDEGAFLLTGDVEMVDCLGKDVAEALSGRGGGKNGRFQGKGMRIRSRLAEARQRMVEETRRMEESGGHGTEARPN